MSDIAEKKYGALIAVAQLHNGNTPTFHADIGVAA